MKNRKVEKEKLCCYFVWPLSFNLSGLGSPNRSIKTPASIAIRVTEARIPHTTKRWQYTGTVNEEKINFKKKAKKEGDTNGKTIITSINSRSKIIFSGRLCIFLTTCHTSVCTLHIISIRPVFFNIIPIRGLEYEMLWNWNTVSLSNNWYYLLPSRIKAK